MIEDGLRLFEPVADFEIKLELDVDGFPMAAQALGNGSVNPVIQPITTSTILSNELVTLIFDTQLH